MTRSDTVVLRGGMVAFPDGLRRADITVEDGRIVRMDGAGRRQGPAVRTVDCTGKWILPGFVEIHTHGAAGRRTSDGQPPPD